ncbi:MAG: phosphate/phosphite/phosphonate ABC transporter substrate-binding protein [Candidatus Methanoperedens sp.]|nr:phosphate/phosphite/phosphonate ABC transporter substrate-binding protein [Candidatus Methanoperedens sp.]
MKKIYFVVFILIILTLVLPGCIEKPAKVNLSIVQEPNAKENDTSLKVAFASGVSPKESYAYYEELTAYISRKLGGPIKIVQRRSSLEVNDLIKNKRIDFSFVNSGAYVAGNEEFGMKLLVAPKINGRTTYNSYIIVPKNSTYDNIVDLRGKKFAFSDPLSNSGKLYPAYRLSLINETPDSFFGVDEKGRSNYFYTYSQDYSIIAVAGELADGAAVSSLIYEYMKKTKPDIVSNTRVIEVSPPFAIPPVVVSKDIDPFLEERLKDIFLKMDKDEEGKMILSKIMIDKFVNINDNAYDSIREMRKKV